MMYSLLWVTLFGRGRRLAHTPSAALLKLIDTIWEFIVSELQLQWCPEQMVDWP